MNELNKWDCLVVSSLILNNEFNITQVNEFETIKSMLFDEENYSWVKSLIEQRDWESIQSISGESKIGFREYLEIIKFSDQVSQNYIATIYDSDALEQEPQIIEIFKLN